MRVWLKEVEKNITENQSWEDHPQGRLLTGQRYHQSPCKYPGLRTCPPAPNSSAKCYFGGYFSYFGLEARKPSVGGWNVRNSRDHPRIRLFAYLGVIVASVL